MAAEEDLTGVSSLKKRKQSFDFCLVIKYFSPENSILDCSTFIVQLRTHAILLSIRHFYKIITPRMSSVAPYNSLYIA